jgi:hypothetical protein
MVVVVQVASLALVVVVVVLVAMRLARGVVVACVDGLRLRHGF